jgi:hypothetical protein
MQLSLLFCPLLRKLVPNTILSLHEESIILPDEDKQKSESPDNEQANEEQQSYTSTSFLRMLGVPLPEGGTIEELVESLKKLGAKLWHPESHALENDKVQDDSES